ncbi:MFS transporter [Aneurinibacillus terranovensis]|uniref:MFS transporter n=1 Tax=Aneurinibacillus terranovensis TaxID=278991 RepID=UPI0003F9300C|nr:MFS transporter [Aneurinibacillus terranovensis]
MDTTIVEKDVVESMKPINYSKSETVSKGQVIYASIVAFFAWVFSTYDFILFGTLLPIMAAEFHWSTAQSAGVATWVSVTTFIVSLTVGPIADYFGRRNALMITTAGAALSSGLTGFTMGPLYLIIVRALSGFGYSEQAVNTTYLSEMAGAKKRGFVYSFIQGGWPIGVLFASFITAVLLPSLGWRGVFWVGTIPAVIIMLLRIKLKESPKYEQMREVRELIKEGKLDQAKALGQKTGIDSEKMTKFSVTQLFAPDIRKHTIFLGIAITLNWFAIQIFSVLSTTVLTEGKGISFHNSLFMLIFSNALAYVGYVTHGYLGDKFGRRGTIIVSWILAGLSYTVMLFLAHGYWPVLISYSIGLFFLIGSYAALYTYMGESFPTRIRGTGAAFINAMGPVGAILASLLFTVTVSGFGAVTATFLAGVIPLILSGILMFGTKSIAPSKELEEISQ